MQKTPKASLFLEELEEIVESPVCDPLKEEGADVIAGKPNKEVPLENKNTGSDVGLDIGCTKKWISFLK